MNLNLTNDLQSYSFKKIAENPVVMLGMKASQIEAAFYENEKPQDNEEETPQLPQ